MANLTVHQTIPYWQVYSANLDVFQGAILHAPCERATAKNTFMNIHDIPWPRDNHANWKSLQYTKSNADKGFTWYSRPVAACRCAQIYRGNPRHLTKTTLHCMFLVPTLSYHVLYIWLVPLLPLSLARLTNKFIIHTTHGIDAHIRTLKHNIPSRKGARPHTHKHTNAHRIPITHLAQAMLRLWKRAMNFWASCHHWPAMCVCVFVCLLACLFVCVCVRTAWEQFSPPHEVSGN